MALVRIKSQWTANNWGKKRIEAFFIQGNGVLLEAHLERALGLFSLEVPLLIKQVVIGDHLGHVQL